MPIQTLNPATGEVVKTFNALTPSEINDKLDVAQEFEVRWSVPTAKHTGPIGAAIGLGVAAIPALMHPSFAAAGLTLGAVCAGALAGMAVARERLRQ